MARSRRRERVVAHNDDQHNNSEESQEWQEVSQDVESVQELQEEEEAEVEAGSRRRRRESEVVDEVSADVEDVQAEAAMTGTVNNTGSVDMSAGDANSVSLQRQAQVILDKLQSKRQQDAQMLDDYRRKLENRVEQQVKTLQNRIYEMHSQRNASVQPVLHELQSVLTRCRGLETDISQFKDRLSTFHALVNGR